MVEVVTALADTVSSGGVTAGQVLYERVGADRTSAARSIVSDRGIRQIWKHAHKTH